MKDTDCTHFADLIDLVLVRNMIEANYSVSGVPGGIMDAQDGSILVWAGGQDICANFHRKNLKSVARCRESGEAASGKMSAGRPLGYNCLNGLWNVGFPIMAAGRHLATLLMGQFFRQDQTIDMGFFENQARELCFDKDAYLTALSRVPVVSREKTAAIQEQNRSLAIFLGKQAESELRLRERQVSCRTGGSEPSLKETFMQSLVETIPIPLYVKDTGCHYIGCNRAFERMVGKSREEIVGKTVQEVYAPIETSEYERMDSELLQSGDRQVLRVRLAAPGPEELDYEVYKAVLRDSSGRATGIVGLNFDITERLRNERELEKSRNLIRNILESTPSAIICVDEHGVVNHWNAFAKSLFGRTRDSALGMALQQATPLLAGHLDKLAAAIEHREISQVESLSVTHGGETRLLDVQFYPLVSNGVIGAVIRADDVTERERLREMMIQTEKMMSVGGLAAGMAHEINNPLGAIMQSAQMVVRRLDPDMALNREAVVRAGCQAGSLRAYLEDRRILEFLEGIREAGTRASRIVSNMLEFSRKADSGREPVSLASLLDKSLELAASDYDLKKKYDFRHIVIVREYAPGLPPVSCVRTEIEQVFLNLLRNAAQAMALKSFSNERPTLVLRTHGTGDKATVEFEDNGPGLEEWVRRKVFDPFFTTKEPGEGTGLGLSVSYFIIANKHGGTILVESEPGKGTKFVVELPFGGPALRSAQTAGPASSI
jgi:PAS domain S-box-containing protein